MNKQKQFAKKPETSKTAVPPKQAPPSPTGQPLLLAPSLGAHLQRTIGNRALGNLILQRKLTLGPVDDPYEREADAAAKEVVSRLNVPTAQREEALPEEEPLQAKPSLQRQENEEELFTKPTLQREEALPEEETLQTKPTLQREEALPEEETLQTKPVLQREEALPEEETLQTKPVLQREEALPEEETLQTKPVLQREEALPEEDALQTKAQDTSAGGPLSDEIESSIQGARGGGASLSDTVRAPMESAFDADFSSVKIHTGGQADTLNRSLQARAFTTGSDIFFRSGEYNPGSSSGQELIAHELTHVVQQNGRSLQRHTIDDAPVDAEQEEAVQPKTAVRRHTIDDAPVDAEQEEAVQPQSLIQRRPAVTLTQPNKIQRGLGSAIKKAAKWARYGDVSVSPGEIPADGQTTARAKASRFGAREVNWSIEGEDYGSSIDNKGVITAGDKLEDRERGAITIKATNANDAGKFVTGKLKLKHPHLEALKEYKQFTGSDYQFENFTIGKNGKFDVDYKPKDNRVNINMKVKFNFPNDQPTPGESEEDTKAREQRQEEYRNSFVSQVTTAWSQRYSFKNTREPQEIWDKLSPTTVKLNVNEVESGQHFEIQVRQNTPGRASVGGGVTKLYQGDDTAQEKFNPVTGQGELKRVRRIAPDILFENNSHEISANGLKTLNFLADYMRRINNPQFTLEIVGHASATGDPDQNQTLSEKRAEAVTKALTDAGLTNHTLNTSGVGQTGAAADAAWRKVSLTPNLTSGWKNKQDVTAHEFGHMIGLGDEYGSGNATHYDLTKKAFGEDYADQVAKRGDTDYASIMEGGDDVRIQHYVTFWDALVKTAAKAPVPDPKFSHDDWKFIG